MIINWNSINKEQHIFRRRGCYAINIMSPALKILSLFKMCQEKCNFSVSVATV